jgi:archaemetzincin
VIGVLSLYALHALGDTVLVQIAVVPVGSFPIDLAIEIAAGIKERVPIPVEVQVSTWRLTPPLTLYSWSRMQFRARELLEYIASRVPGLRPPKRLALGLSEADAYISGLNFVFGLASPPLGAAIVFTARLKTENIALYKSRLLKESLHEIGHLLGLEHCPTPGCVMNFSNSVTDVDRKSDSFCERCRVKLRSILSSLE